MKSKVNSGTGLGFSHPFGRQYDIDIGTGGIMLIMYAVFTRQSTRYQVLFNCFPCLNSPPNNPELGTVMTCPC